MQDNLNNIIRTQRLQSDDIRYIIYQILSGLNYLHKCGIIHGDLKPSDIGINKDFTAKIIDLNVEQPKEADYVLTKWFVEIFWEWTLWRDFSFAFLAGIGRQRFCSGGKLQRRKLIYGVWAALWLSSYVEESFSPDVIVSFPAPNFRASNKWDSPSSSSFMLFIFLVDLQQLRLILEMLGTPPKDFFNPSCHLCITTQNLMTGEKFVRSLPYFRKRSLRRIFEECDDDVAISFIEQLLQLEPNERTSAQAALKHPYLNKHSSEEESSSSSPQKFEESFEVENEDWISCIEANIEIKN